MAWSQSLIGGFFSSSHFTLNASGVYDSILGLGPFVWFLFFGSIFLKRVRLKKKYKKDRGTPALISIKIINNKNRIDDRIM